MRPLDKACISLSAVIALDESLQTGAKLARALTCTVLERSSGVFKKPTPSDKVRRPILRVTFSARTGLDGLPEAGDVDASGCWIICDALLRCGLANFEQIVKATALFGILDPSTEE